MCLIIGYRPVIASVQQMIEFTCSILGIQQRATYNIAYYSIVHRIHRSHQYQMTLMALVSTGFSYNSPQAGPITLFSLLTIVSLLFSIVLSVSMKFSPGGRSPLAWLFQNPRWPPRWLPWTYESIILHNVRSKYSIIALLVLIIMFLTSRNLIITLI